MQRSRDIVAYFDFDGTLTTKDTLLPFLIYCVKWPIFLIKAPLLFPTLVLYVFKIITNEEAKQRTLIILLKGYSFKKIDKLAQKFAQNKLSKYIKPEVFAKLEYHKEHAHQIILVSANLAVYLRYLAQIYKLDGVIATEIEFIDNIATGRLATPNCYGLQKTIRINEYLVSNNLKYSYRYAYGNSPGDYELLDYVDEGYWVEGILFKSWADIAK